MPDNEIRRVVSGNRRDGRRSLSAYGSHARGVRDQVTVRLSHEVVGRGLPRRGGLDRSTAGVWTAGVALAIVYPLITHRARNSHSSNGSHGPHNPHEEPGGMKRKPTISSLETVSFEEATAYLDHSDGDELDAACALACDRNRLDGSHIAPDDPEIHHALFLLCRARGKQPPSFDEMRIELRRRIAA